MAEAAVKASIGNGNSSPISATTDIDHAVGGEKHATSGGKRLTLRELEQKMTAMQSSTDSKFEAIMTLLQDRPSGQGESNNYDSTMGLPARRNVDELSIHPSQTEVRNLFSDSNSSVSSAKSHVEKEKMCTYDKYVEKTDQNLTNIFHTSTADQKPGIVLDQCQQDILSKSWRSENPSKLTAYKDEYRLSFPVSDKSEDFLQVPGLDDLIEPMLRKRHGKSVKAWGKGKQLYSQPLKAMESLAYQGQMASRYGIVALSYLQQGLGSLMNSLTEKEPNIDRSIQTVRDLFDMSSKALDQVGRSGAFHHVVRRKAAFSDTGLDTLKDINVKVLDLPLTGVGVFGKGLEDKLKDRKEKKDQLNDLVPEISEKKRQWSSSGSFDRPDKRQKTSTYTAKPTTSQASSRPSTGKGSFHTDKGKPRERFEQAPPSFRIPKKK